MKPAILFPEPLAVIVLPALFLLTGCGGDTGKDTPGAQPSHIISEKVRLDIHIMSKCTWSAKVLTTLFPIMEKMGDNIDLKLHYIAREEKGGWKSTHGESEITGDTIQLCVNKHSPNDAQWISFVKCQIEDWSHIPAGWEKCAQKSNLDLKQIQKCVDGEEGKQLLVDSFKYSQEKGAKGSPTIFLEGEPYTGGRTEASFRRAICDKFSTDKPEYCNNIPKPTKVPVTVVTDKRCQGRACNPRRFLAFIRSTFEGAEIRTLDYGDPEGKKIFEKSGQPWLPVAIFGANVEKVENGFNRLKRHLVKLPKTGEYVYPLGETGKPPWNPTAEICDDKVDNTGNGKIDCDDESCDGKKVCRIEKPRQVDLFVMSHCHYGVRTVNAMAPVLEHFNNSRDNINFNMQFIGKIENDKLTALHGPGEVAENKRQICAQKYYDKNYKFMDYVLCRNDYFQKNSGREDEHAWEECARNDISAAVLKKCAEGDEGEQLLADSYRLADSLGLTGSPSWLLNNRFDMRGRSPQQIKDAFCERNRDVEGCDKPLEKSSGAPQTPLPDSTCDGNQPPIPKKSLRTSDTDDASPAGSDTVED